MHAWQSKVLPKPSLRFQVHPSMCMGTMYTRPSFLYPLPINLLTPVSIYTHHSHPPLTVSSCTSHSHPPSLTNFLYPSHHFMIHVPILMKTKSHTILDSRPPLSLSMSSYPPSPNPSFSHLLIHHLILQYPLSPLLNPYLIPTPAIQPRLGRRWWRRQRILPRIGWHAMRG